MSRVGLAGLPGGLRPRHRSPAFQSFCCECSRDLYEFIVAERRSRERAHSVPSATAAPDATAPSAVTPHEPHGTEADRRLSKDRAYQR